MAVWALDRLCAQTRSVVRKKTGAEMKGRRRVCQACGLVVESPLTVMRLAGVAAALLFLAAPVSGHAAGSTRLTGDRLCAFAVRAADASQSSDDAHRRAGRARDAARVIARSLTGRSVLDDSSAEYVDHLHREAQALRVLAVEAQHDEQLADIAATAAEHEAEQASFSALRAWLPGMRAGRCPVPRANRIPTNAVPPVGTSFSTRTVFSRPAPTNPFRVATTATRITVPVTFPPVRALLAFAPGHPVYNGALRELLGVTGSLFYSDVTPFVREHPVVTVDDGIAKVLVETSDTLPWSAESGLSAARATTFTLRRTADKQGAAGSITLSLPGVTPLSIRPLPARIDRNRELTWQIGAGRSADLRVTAQIARRSSLARRIHDFSGNWIWLYPANPWLAVLLPLLLLAWALPRRRELGSAEIARAASAARGSIAATLILALSGMVAFWLLWASYYWHSTRFEVTTRAAGTGVILLATVLFFLSGRRSARRAAAGTRSSRLGRSVVLLAFLVGALAATPFLADAPLFGLFGVPGRPWLVWLVLSGGLFLALTVTFMLVAGAAAPLVAAGYQVARSREASPPPTEAAPPKAQRWRESPSTVAVIVAAAGAVVVLGHWLLSARDSWATGLGPTRPLEHFARAPFWPTGIQPLLAGYPRDILAGFVDILPYIALLGLVWVVTAARDAKSGVLVLDAQPWMRRAVAAVFAGFVVGTRGSIPSLGIAAPAALVVGFVCMYRLPWGRKARAQEEVRKASAAHDADATGQTSSGRVFLARGPGISWWENLTAGLFIGSVLAVLPVGFYLYVFLAHLNQTLHYNTYFSLLYALAGVFTEFSFWLSAAGVTAVLYPYLPGWNGPLKGLAVAGIYVLSIGTAALVLHEHVDPRWPFRSFELVLFLLLLGVALDLRTIRRRGGSWRELWEYYEVDKLQGIAIYLVPVTLALIGIGEQIASGHAQNAIVEIIKSFTAVPGGK
jgi:hypothetical protein